MVPQFVKQQQDILPQQGGQFKSHIQLMGIKAIIEITRKEF